MKLTGRVAGIRGSYLILSYGHFYQFFFSQRANKSFEHFTNWNRMAIVTDERWVRKAYDMLSPLVYGVINGYELKQYEEAKSWVSEPLEADA